LLWLDLIPRQLLIQAGVQMCHEDAKKYDDLPFCPAIVCLYFLHLFRLYLYSSRMGAWTDR
jgi:hypothetical protein